MQDSSNREDALDPIEMCPAERIVLGENEDGSLEVLVTPAGRAAAAQAGLPVDCDLCRVVFKAGDVFYHVTIGIDDTPDFIGAEPGQHNLVESMTELTLCRGCERRVAPLVDQLLETLWGMRAVAPDEHDDGPPTEKV